MSAKYASRYEAVFLCTHPKGPKMSQSAAAKYMRKSKAFVQKWIQRYKVAKNVDDLPERGSIGKVDKKDEKKIVNLFSRNPALTLRQGQAKLKSKGLDISYETIRTHLRAHDLKFRNTMKKPLLTEKHVTKRLAWAHENIDRDFDNVISIENVWAYIKQKLRGKRTHTLKQLLRNSSDLEIVATRIRRQISRKHASEMPGNYRRRW